MTRRIIATALIVLGVIAIALAIASATVWRPTDTATLTLPARPDTPLVISDAGVLDAVDPDVTIVATADADQPVTLAVGRTEDVVAWVGTSAHTRITGLETGTRSPSRTSSRRPRARRRTRPRTPASPTPPARTCGSRSRPAPAPPR
ncbi:hypothetical protein [Georgenia yuyongxinii]